MMRWLDPYKVILVGALLLLLVIIGFLIGRYGLKGSAPYPRARAPDAQMRALEALQGEMETLRTEMRGLQAQQRLHAPGPSPGASPDLGRTANSTRSPQDLMRMTQANIEIMDKRFENLPNDPNWSVKKQQSISQAVASDIPAAGGGMPENYNVDCKKEMCRISARFASTDASEQWGNLLVAAIADDLPRTRILTIQNPDGSTGLMIYAVTPARAGQVNLRTSPNRH